MSTTIKLLVGLANPGPEYKNTRHNAGLSFLNQIASQQNIQLKAEAKFYGLTGRMQFAGNDLRLLVPTTFMNLSGKSVAAMANFYRIKPEEILVAHDELDIPPGCIKFKLGGSHGGHNGLRDIISKLGNNKNFYRLRIGIGHPGDRNRVSSFVLSKASRTEQNLIDQSIDEAAHCLLILGQDGLAKAMNRLHSFKANN
ncbi:aminoacyl-tRNA hydrolase [Psychromonas sp. CD1]|uniref:aminoacyl-tRNA hydrolase n=1 Tax=Psychromonas sp. CD1 TaxID=1979839 RepID=UPI000B9C5D0A|nr:aminoacyl-tRNA hydrolase [Psychromonas sp. CD1]